MNYLAGGFCGLLMVTAAAAHAHDAPQAGHHSSDQSCARYIANEGVMVTAGAAKILFDAFYEDSYGQYALVSEATRKALINGAPPYDQVDALFVSHVHGDHFSPAPTLEFLRAQKNVTLYASGQVIDALREAGAGEALAARLKAFDLEAGDAAQSVIVGPLEIDVVRIPHAGGPGRADIENLAFRVTLDGALTVMHMGDADPADRHFAPYQDHWDKKTLNIAFPPYWFYGGGDGDVILRERLKAEKTIGVHVPTAASGNGDAWRKKHGGDLFTDPGETRSLSEGGCAG